MKSGQCPEYPRVVTQQEHAEMALSEWLGMAGIEPDDDEWERLCEAIEEDRRGLARGALKIIHSGYDSKRKRSK